MNQVGPYSNATLLFYYYYYCYYYYLHTRVLTKQIVSLPSKLFVYNVCQRHLCTIFISSKKRLQMHD